MELPLSSNEREALSRFVSKLIEDVDKVATLLESRGAHSEYSRSAQTQLERTLDMLQAVERLEFKLEVPIPEKI